jgi:hypothetical protein
MRISKTAAAAALSLAVTGLGFTAAAPASADSSPTVTVNPNSNLKDMQSVTVTVANFTAASSSNNGSGSATDIECSQAALAALKSGDSLLQVAGQYCDTNSISTVPVDNNGNGSAPFTVYSSSYSDQNGDKCDSNDPCLIAAADNPFSPTQFNYAQIMFAASSGGGGGSVPTQTTVTAPKSGKAGSKVKVTATTQPTQPGTFSGKVTFKDNGKTVGTVKEKSTGKVTDKVKLAKGTNKITATYSGNSSFAGSSGNTTVKGTK